MTPSPPAAVGRAEAAGGEVVIATGNAGKLREFRDILGHGAWSLRGLGDFDPFDFPEEGDDYTANAAAKALTAASSTGRVALADDSGLEVDALGGAPGPRSARYGGPGLDDRGRAATLLAALAGVAGEGRSARFVCVAALAEPGGGCVTARGECPGRILTAPQGDGGFGYDPVFEVEPGRSMAELSTEQKHAISHRARALQALQAALAKLAG